MVPSPLSPGFQPLPLLPTRLYFPELEPWVAQRSASLPAVCPVYLWANVVPQGLLVVRWPAPLIPHSSSLGPATATGVLYTLVPVSAPPNGPDVCFRLSCRSIFCQIWLCEEVQCVYLRCHLGSPLSVLLSFCIPSSFHPLPFLFFLPAFFYLSFSFNFC